MWRAVSFTLIIGAVVGLLSVDRVQHVSLLVFGPSDQQNLSAVPVAVYAGVESLLVMCFYVGFGVAVVSFKYRNPERRIFALEEKLRRKIRAKARMSRDVWSCGHIRFSFAYTGYMDRPPDVVLPMAALIASVRTARFEEKEFRGMKSPRYQAAMAV